MNILFSKPVGVFSVQVTVGGKGFRHLVTLHPDAGDAEANLLHLTPQQAAELGRALIKAGKVAGKSKVYGVLHITNADRRAFDTRGVRPAKPPVSSRGIAAAKFQMISLAYLLEILLTLPIALDSSPVR